MSVSVASFKVRYPEFTLAGDAMLTAALAGVEATVGEDVFDTEGERDEFVMQSLARALATSPMGRDAKMVSKDGTTAYDERLSGLRDGNACLHPNRWGST